MTKKDAALFKKRWKTVNHAEINELRSTTFARKFLQLQVLISAYRIFESRRIINKDISIVRKRWFRLRRLAGHG